VGVFRYSREEGTHSFELGEPVQESVVSERVAELMEIQRAISREKLAGYLRRELDVLVEGVSEESEFLLQGRHAGQAPEVDGVVLLTDGTAQPGEIRRARVKQTADYDLVASLLPQRAAPAARAKRSRLPVVR
jgi:ribosomal protein S12 methylthiotransferase